MLGEEIRAPSDVWCRCAACGNVALVRDTEDARGMLECRKCGNRRGVHPASPPQETHGSTPP